MSGSMNRIIRENPHVRDGKTESWLSARSAGNSTDLPAIRADAQTATIAQARRERDRVGPVWRAERTTPDCLVEALTQMSRRSLVLKARNRELAGDVKRLRAEGRRLQSPTAAGSHLQPVQIGQPAHEGTFLAGEDERRRLERDLHDGVQNELVALIVKLTLAEQDRDTPPANAGTLSELAARAEAALHSVREIAHGIYPSPLAAFGVLEALRAQAMRASLDVSVEGTALHSTDEADVAVYLPVWRRSRTS